MLGLAHCFIAAADDLTGDISFVAPHHPVPHYLYAHGIELALKAFLCCRRTCKAA